MNKSILTVFLLLPLLYISCVQDNPEDLVSPLQIGRVTVSGISVKSENELISGDIGISRMGSYEYGDALYSVHYTNNGSGWEAASGVTPIYLKRFPAKLSAYYPYTEPYSDNITLTSQLYSPEKDILFQSNVFANRSSPVSFTLGHAYSVITLNFIREASYTGTCAISGISICNDGLNASGQLQLSTGNYSNISYGNISVNPAVASIKQGNCACVKILMVPCSIYGKVDMKFTIDNLYHSFSLNASDAGLSSLEPGKNYKIDIHIGSTSTATSTANCYIVAPGETLCIPVNIKGNGGNVAASGLSTTHKAASVGILWQTDEGLITLGTFDSSSQTVIINTNTSEISGNAVIAAYSGESQTGDILWSWHIWVTDYKPEDPSDNTKYSYTNLYDVTNVFMDRNLGATSADPYNYNNLGLLYQWGRKDPFVNTDISNFYWDSPVYGTPICLTSGQADLAASIANPTNFYYFSGDWNSSPDNTLWGEISESRSSTKTIFDPCPIGWKVPGFCNTSGISSPWIGIETIYGSAVSSDRQFLGTDLGTVLGFWPASGMRSCENGMLQAAFMQGFYWSAFAEFEFAFFINFGQDYWVSQVDAIERSIGMSVRCVQE